MTVALSAIEARILGSLIEKAATTPDNYPLSTNALRLACNQSSNRDPVVDYDDRTVDAVMLNLRQRGLARTVHQAGSRVSKHRHVLDEALGLTPAELAVLAVLLLRGPQTVAELTARTERYAGGPVGPGGVEVVIDRLAFGDDPLVTLPTRRPGEREPRVIHRFDEPDPDGGSPIAVAGSGPIPFTAPPVPSALGRALDDERPSRVGSVFHPDREERRPIHRPATASGSSFDSGASPAPGSSFASASLPGPSSGPAMAVNPAAAGSAVDVGTEVDPLIEEVLRLRQRVTDLERGMDEQAARIDQLVEELGG